MLVSLFLQVAQEQLAEYASEKSAAASAILQQAEALEGTLQQLLAASSSSADAAGPDAVAAAMQQLKAQLMQAAVEAQAFAEQQQADVERAKRSSRQVGVCFLLLRVPPVVSPDLMLPRCAQLSASPFLQQQCGGSSASIPLGGTAARRAADEGLDFLSITVQPVLTLLTAVHGLAE